MLAGWYLLITHIRRYSELLCRRLGMLDVCHSLIEVMPIQQSLISVVLLRL